MSSCRTEHEPNCELNIWLCEQLELAHTTLPTDKELTTQVCEHEMDKTRWEQMGQ